MKKCLSMWKLSAVIAPSIIALSLPVAVKADQTLTFEGFASDTVLTTQYAGIDFNGAQILTAGVSLNIPAFPPHSGTNVIYNPSGAMSLTFSTPISYFSGYVTYNMGMTIQAYDSANNLLGTVDGSATANYVGSGGPPPNELLTITEPDITTVVLTGGTGNNFTLDDVMFPGSVNLNAPDASPTWLLLGAGLAGLALVNAGSRKFASLSPRA